MTRIILFASILTLGRITNGEGTESGKAIFADKFDRVEIGEKWKIKEGNWAISEGALINTNGGTIVLSEPIRDDFTLECEARIARWNSPWVYVLLGYADDNHYRFLELSSLEGYFWLGERSGEVTSEDVCGKIPFEKDIFHKARLECSGSTARFFWDGKYIAKYRYTQLLTPTLIGFMGNKNGAEYEIKNVKIGNLVLSGGQTVATAPATDIANGELWLDTGHTSEKQSRHCKLTDNSVWLDYNFHSGRDYEGIFSRFTVKIGESDSVELEVNGDGSGNRLYLIIKDIGRESHFVGQATINWTGWKTIAFDYSDYTQPSPQNEVRAEHWEGDMNQKIDFPIKQMEIGVAKSAGAEKLAGKIGMLDVRFMNNVAK